MERQENVQNMKQKQNEQRRKNIFSLDVPHNFLLTVVCIFLMKSCINYLKGMDNDQTQQEMNTF